MKVIPETRRTHLNRYLRFYGALFFFFAFIFLFFNVLKLVNNIGCNSLSICFWDLATRYVHPTTQEQFTI